jgi:putative copper export protein
VTHQSSRGRARAAPAAFAAALVVAVLAMVVALVAAGGAPTPSPEGLIGAGTTVSWAVPVLRLIADVAAIACAGGVLAAVVLLPADGGRLGAQGRRACQDAAFAAAAWAAATIAGVVVTAAVILGIPLSELASRASDAAELSQVRILAASVVLITLLAVVLSGCRSVRAAHLSLLLTGFALAGPLLTGHAASERTAFWSFLASVSLIVHVFAATAWVGGLGALVRYGHSGDPTSEVARFSRLALICAVVIGLTGLLTAEIHLGGRQNGWGLVTQWVTTGYGAIVFAKASAFASLVGIGWWHRSRSLPALQLGRDWVFWRLAAVELAVMAATIGLAVALSRTP